MTVISCRSLSKTYIVDTILYDINFNVANGDKIGVIGLNGSGKTTLFNILAGEEYKDEGDIFIKKELNIGYLKQHVQIVSDNTIFNECLEVFTPLIEMEEELRDMEKKISKESSKESSKILDDLMEEYGVILEKFNELNGYGYKSEIRGVLIGLGFEEEDFNKEINILSGGQKSRVSLAKLLLEKPDILLLDEPTNHLDIEAIDWLEGYLKEYTGAALIISHDRYFLDNTINRIFHLENTGIKTYDTDYTDFMTQRKRDLDIISKQYEDQQKEIARQEEIIERYMNTRDVGKVRQAQSRQKLLDQMKRIEKPNESQASTRIRFEPNIQSGVDVLSVKDLNKSFGDLHLLKDIGFNIYRGDRVGLIGANGIGKTTLFEIILGNLDYDSGSIQLGTNVFTGYFDQEMENLNPEKTVMDQIWDEHPNMTYYDIRKILSQFLFVGDDILKYIKDLSGGEKGRLNLLKLMLSKANLLIMDEPTNHLDIDSKEVLEDALNDYDGTLFVISHDRYFLNQSTDKILELTEDGIIEYMGNYDYYLEKKNELESTKEDDKITMTKTQLKEEKKKQREQMLKERKEKRNIKDMERQIEELESKIGELDNQMADPKLYDDHEKALILSSERDKLQEKLDKTYNKWIHLID